MADTKRRSPARPWTVRAADSFARFAIERFAGIDFDELYVGDPCWFGMERMDTRTWLIWLYTGGPDHERITIAAQIHADQKRRVQFSVVEGGELLRHYEPKKRRAKR